MDKTKPGEEQAETKQEEKQEEYVICPCCKNPTKKKTLKPNQALVDHWLSCMMTNTPFSHTYKIYDGKLEITVVRLTTEQLDKLALFCTLVNLLIKRFERENLGIDKDSLLNAVKLNLCIKSIALNPSSLTGGRLFPVGDNVQAVIDSVLTEKDAIYMKKEDDDARLKALILDVVAKMRNDDMLSSVPVQLRLAAVETHAAVHEALLSFGFDDSFWAGIELA